MEKKESESITLADLQVGQDAVLRAIGGKGELRHHLLDMGLTPGTEVTLRKVAPMGNPIEVELRGYELTLRLADAAQIEAENIHETDRAQRSESRHTPIPHPGVGELHRAPSYRDRKLGAEIAKGQPLHFALAGNQNCGKTTLFNQLTGSNQHVGNFPGVTVDRKDGVIRGHEEATVIIWFMQTFDVRLNVAQSPDSCLLALVGSWVAPVFRPLGFGDWRVSAALITGFTAKESVVSTLTVLLGGDTASLSAMFTPGTALVFLVFTLLYTPCVAAIAAARRELGSKRAAGVVLMQCGIAWAAAFAVHTLLLAAGVV